MTEQVTDDVTTGQKVAGASCNATLSFISCKSSVTHDWRDAIFEGASNCVYDIEMNSAAGTSCACLCFWTLQHVISRLCLVQSVNAIMYTIATLYDKIMPETWHTNHINNTYTQKLRYKECHKIYKQAFAHYTRYIYMSCMDVKVHVVQIAAGHAMTSGCMAWKRRRILKDSAS